VPENLAVACRTCNKRRRTKSIAAFVRSQLDAGERPRLDLLVAALERMSGSPWHRHAEYARRQLTLLGRIETVSRPSSKHSSWNAEANDGPPVVIHREPRLTDVFEAQAVLTGG
jgi:hypothetical protein